MKKNSIAGQDLTFDSKELISPKAVKLHNQISDSGAFKEIKTRIGVVNK